MALRERVETLIAGLSDEDTITLKKSLKISVDSPLPDIDTLTDICTPSYLGPTWETDGDDWFLPERTLGWELAAWASEFLANPNDPELPWEFTMEQLRFLLWWYAVDDRGRFSYRRGVLQRIKGWGKDPLLAVICLIELLAPCRFKEFDQFGNPVGKPVTSALVQVAATTLEQTQNTGEMIPLLLTKKCIKAYNVKYGAEITRARNGRAKLQMITSSPRAIEGKRSTFVVLNETHHWVSSNSGPQMYAAISRNLTKMRDARYLAITNAYMPGEGSVAEMMRMDFDKAGVGGRSRSMLYDSIEADPRAPIVGPLVPLVVDQVRGDAHWLDLEAIQDEMATESIDLATSRRFWLNQIVASDDRIYGPEDWDHLGNLDITLRRGEAITLGFDGGRTDDATALVAIRLKDMRVFTLAVWEPDKKRKDEKGIVDYQAVDFKVRQAFELYDVRVFYADVSGWEPWIVQWTEEFQEKLHVRASNRSPIGLDMRGNQARLTQMHEALIQTIRQGKLSHDGNQTMRQHLLNACWYTNRFGLYFKKDDPESPNKVDAYAALLLAFIGATDLKSSKQKQEQPKSGGRTFLLR